MSKFTDKFLGMLKLNDEDDYDEEYDEEYDDEEDEDIEEEVEEPVKKVSRFDLAKNKDVEKEQPTKSRFSGRQTKVVPMRNQRGGSMEVCVIKPSTVDDGREITDTLLSGRAVILNLEGLHADIAQRILDFTSGSCWAIDGNLQKISSYIFIITPQSVEISGDFQEILSGGFDVASMSRMSE